MKQNYRNILTPIPTAKSFTNKKFKAFSDNKFSLAIIIKFVSERAENILQKGVSSLLLTMFLDAFFDIPVKENLCKHSPNKRKCWFRAFSPYFHNVFCPSQIKFQF